MLTEQEGSSNMVYVTGDLHGDYSRFKRPEMKKLRAGDILLVCGDFGFIWDNSKQERAVLKKLSEKKREKLFDEITENALAWSVSLVDERVIDEINILQATYRAMKQAVDGLTRPADFVYVDGNRSQGLEQPHECVVSGDAKIPSVAAASIIAKVTRDRLMRQFAEQYPQYGFEKHKGYETKAHDEALLEHGPCPIHRMTFLKKFYEKHPDAPR